MKFVTVGEFLTGAEIQRAITIYQDHVRTTGGTSGVAKKIESEIITPNLERINKALGQENNALYLAYMVEFVIGQNAAEDALVN